jgi:hypothetical protein
MVKWWSVVLVLAVSFWNGKGGTPAYTAGDVFEQASLRGLNSVQVVVEDLALDVTQDGLNREQIKAAVEQQLQRAGIGVEQQADTAFYIHVGTMKTSTGLYSYSLSLQLQQLVLLFRDPSLVTWGTTWSLDQVGSIAPANIEEVASLITRGVNAFIADYQVANPTTG